MPDFFSKKPLSAEGTENIIKPLRLLFQTNLKQMV